MFFFFLTTIAPDFSAISDVLSVLLLSITITYFTNFSREEVVSHYKSQFDNIYTVILNYPPEDAQAIIRDQTRSTYLQELTQPFRESIFINGFEPRQDKDDIWYKGTHFEQKITIKQVESHFATRALIVLASYSFTAILIVEGNNELKFIKNNILKLKR